MKAILLDLLGIAIHEFTAPFADGELIRVVEATNSDDVTSRVFLLDGIDMEAEQPIARYRQVRNVHTIAER